MMSCKRHILPPWMTAAGTLAILGIILLLAAYLIRDVNLRLDTTKQHLFTLSQVTRDSITQMDKNVTIRFYYTHDAARLPVNIRRFARRVEEMLTEYATLSNGRIRLQKVNPRPDTDDEDAALLDGIEPQNGTQLGIDGNVYLGASFRCEGRLVPLPLFLPEREAMLEYDITGALLSVLRPARRPLGLITALPLFGGPVEIKGKTVMRPPWHILGELQKAYDITRLQLNAETIPDNIELLLIIHPKNLDEQTTKAIDRFIQRGGKLLAFLDPLCVAELQSNPRDGKYILPDAASSLTPLLKAWGVTFSESQVVIDTDASATVHLTPNAPPKTFPFILNLSADNLRKSDPALAGLSAPLFFNSGAFSGTAADGLTLTPLLRTSTHSQFIEPYMTQRNPDDILRDFKSDDAAKILAIRLEGKFPAAFPSAKEKKPSSDTTVVLVGDADLLYDPFCGRYTERNGQRTWQPTTHNVTFALNMLENLAGDRQLSQIRARAVLSRPFLKMQEMDKEAERNYNAELEKLTAELLKVRQEIRDLQQKIPADQQHLISREQREAVARYRQQQAQTNRNIKALRKKMRREITALENRITLLNIALMPLLVIIAGIFVAFRRK